MNKFCFLAVIFGALACSAYTPPTHKGTFTRDGVTYVQRGGLGSADYVVTNVDVSVSAPVRSVNGKSGDVVLDAISVGALADNKDVLVTNANFTSAVSMVSPKVGGEARVLPKYLHYIEFNDTYESDAQWYYDQPHDYGGCSSVRFGYYHYRNFDFPFDDRAEFVVRVTATEDRFASIGVAQVGTNLTESIVESGEWSRWYKCLAGAVVDGINEYGVVANINVVSGEPAWRTTGYIHPLGAVRYVLDHAKSALEAAQSIATWVKFPAGWTQNFHYMVSDANETYIIENGFYYKATGRAVMTNFPLYPTHGDGEGQERYNLLNGGDSITNAWYTGAYSKNWVSEFSSVAEMQAAHDLWATKPKEQHRGEAAGGKTWWQSVHTSIYDIQERTLKIAVQEKDDWYVFQLNAPISRGVGNSVSKDFGIYWNWQNSDGNGSAFLGYDSLDDDIVFSGIAYKAFRADWATNTKLLLDEDSKIRRRSDEVWYITDANHLEGAPIAAVGDKVSLANVTNAQGGAVAAYDVGAVPAVTNEYGFCFVPVMLAMTNSAAVFGSFFITDDSGYMNVAQNIRNNESEINRQEAEIGDLETRKSNVGHGHNFNDITNVPNFVKTIEVSLSGTQNDGNYILTPEAGGYLTLPSINVNNKVENDTDYANVKAKALNSAQYYEYGYPFLGRKDLLVKDVMLVGTEDYTQRANHTEYGDGYIQNEAYGFYGYFPQDVSGTIMIEDPFSFARAVQSVATNHGDVCECVSTNICKIIEPHIEAVNVVEQFYDNELEANWVLKLVNSDLKMSVSTNVDMTAFQRANAVLVDKEAKTEARIFTTNGELKFITK